MNQAQGSAETSQAAVRVLVVDDDAVAARLHAGYVGQHPGFTVVATVGTGEAALNVAAAGAVDLMLLDIGLPGFSGIEVLHRLRTSTAAPVDVLVVSSSRDRVTVRQALSSRVVGYLVKPFTRDALARRLDRYLSERTSGVEQRPEAFGQGEIDALLEHRARLAPQRPQQDLWAAPLPKGLSRPTLEAVVDALRAGGGPHTAADVAAACGASRATVRRYLDHLDGCGVVDVSHRYGGRGRPELLYRLVP